MSIEKLVRARVESQLKRGESYTQFEEVASDEQAYFLGLLCADGCIVTPKPLNAQKVVALSLMEYDIELLEAFKDFLNSPQKISHSKRGYCAVQVPSNKMTHDLAKYGIIPRKTKTVFLPSLGDLTWSFLRGYFDGDGCVMTRNVLVKGRNYPRIEVVFTTGSPTFASDLCSFLASNYVTFSLRNKGTYFQISIGSDSCVRFLYEKMYASATISSSRKKKIFDEYF